MKELTALMTVTELAGRLNMSKNTLYQHINKGVIPAMKIGKCVRVDPIEVLAALEGMRLKARGEAA